jgi:hypothetical protein
MLGINTKKAMGVGQVFIFIMAALTFSLILIFGYKTIIGFISSGEDVAFIQFKEGLEDSIKSIYTEYRAYRLEAFNLPGVYESICFIDLDYDGDDKEQLVDGLRSKNALAASVWEDAADYSEADQNVFLTPTAKVPIKVHNIEIYLDGVDEGSKVGFDCMDIKRSSFQMELEGRGDKTRISLKKGVVIQED